MNDKNSFFKVIIIVLSVALISASGLIITGCGTKDFPGKESGTSCVSDDITGNGDTDSQTDWEDSSSADTATETTDRDETTDKSETTTKNEYTNGAYGVNLSGNIINPLTGLAGDEEMLAKRPVSVMINNLKAALPQNGISEADVIYECTVEGRITRLMMLVMDYEDLGVVGSVRSSREYFIDFAQNHDAIYVAAGGSAKSYEEVKARNIDIIDGVNPLNKNTGWKTDWTLGNAVFYRDKKRVDGMTFSSAEHTLVTTGLNIVKGISYLGYRKEVNDGFVGTLKFIDYNSNPEKPGGGKAELITIPYITGYYPQYKYQSSTKTYFRYQYDGEKHIDGTTGKQLEFTNILIIRCKHTDVPSEKNYIDVDTVGEGIGYYISNGAYETIKWEKQSKDSPMVLYDGNGKPLYMNCGKTFINIVSDSVYSAVTMNKD